MARYFYVGLLAAAVAGAVFFYRTHSPSARQADRAAEFGGVSLRIEYATTPEARKRGLGGRKEVPEGYGMLFIFPKDDYYGFWMKDMLMPLDIFWLDAKGHVVFTARDVATSTYPNVLYPSAPARYVLETAAGFARIHDTATGTPLLLKDADDVAK